MAAWEAFAPLCAFVAHAGDNYAAHKHPKVKAWLARRPRYHPHYAPT